MKKYLNLGCGSRLHESWTNVDLYSPNPSVITLDALDRLPFDNDSFEVVYTSHVLEHIPKNCVLNLLLECHRILQHNGIIRIVVPDLEQMALNYLACLKQGIARPDDIGAQENYEWAMLELYDQSVRTQTGGEMNDFLARKNLAAEQDIFARGGNEIKRIRERLLATAPASVQQATGDKKKASPRFFSSRTWLLRLVRLIAPAAMKQAFQAGAFRLQGELHQWMYDRYSLMLLLQEAGFRTIIQQNADRSGIANWDRYTLDREPDGSEWKPFSLYMEART